MSAAQKLRRDHIALREMSLCTTLQWQFDDLQYRTGIACVFKIDKKNTQTGLNAKQRLELFFLLQECVHTAVTYSNCQQFQVFARCDEQQLLMTFFALQVSPCVHKPTNNLTQFGITSRLDALGCKLVVDVNGSDQNTILTFCSERKQRCSSGFGYLMRLI